MEKPTGNGETNSSNTASKSGLTEMIPPAAKGFIASYWSEAKLVLLSPQEFFRAMPTSGGYKTPFIFLTVCAATHAVLAGLVSFHLPLIWLMFIASMIAVSLGAIVACFLAQAMGSKGSYEATFRVLAYSEATLLFSWVPILGLLPGLYTLALNYIGLKQVHQLSDVQTAAVVLLTGLLTGLVLLLTACTVLLRSIFHF